MKTWFKIAFISVLVFAGAATASAGVSFQIGTDNFFLSVGDYDYLPYAYQDDPGYSPPQINFYAHDEPVWPLGEGISPLVGFGGRMPLMAGVPSPTVIGSTRSMVRIGKAMNPGPGPGITTAPGSSPAATGGSGFRAMNGIRAAWPGRAAMARSDGCRCLPMATITVRDI